MNLFEKYTKIIYKRAHEFSKAYNIPYEEMQSQGYLIYCECLKNYEVGKASFSTYLYIQLGRLRDFAKTYCRQQGYLIQDYYKDYYGENEDYEQKIPAFTITSTTKELLEDARTEMSYNAFLLLKWIVSYQWSEEGKKKPTISQAVCYFNLSRKTVENAWNEIKNFWNLRYCNSYI